MPLLVVDGVVAVVVVFVVVCSLHYTKPVRVWRCAALADGMVVVVVVILVKVRVRCCSLPHPIRRYYCSWSGGLRCSSTQVL